MSDDSNVAKSEAQVASKVQLDEFSYDDGIVRLFTLATLVWGFVSMLVGVIVAILLVKPTWGFGLEWLSFGRLRPLHTNAAIFAFAGNAVFAAVYYSTQRLCKARMWSDLLSQLHFWGWQLIIVAAALTIPFGYTQSKEYAELEWQIDVAIAVVWLVIFGGNFLMTLVNRRERHLYVALWFYIATIIAVAVLHVFNNLVIPVGNLWELESYPIYAGVQDAFMQWWYGHNAVAFFLTTPFLGLMYYFLPKAAERPVFSYKLSIIHFWSLVFIYIWAGPHHLHYTSLAGWASSLGMIFSLMLWMPSWGGMINGLLTLRGAWHKVAEDPVLKFFVAGVTFYGWATFEGPMLSIKSINSLTHYTDWTIAHVHAGALGWNGFMTFGMVYWLLPRIFQTELYSKRLASTHFWIATIGLLLYIIPIYVAGLAQGLMWRALDDQGSMAYPDFVETITTIIPMWWVRVIGGVLFLSGVVLMAYNFLMTWLSRPAQYEVPVIRAAPLAPTYTDSPAPESGLSTVIDSAKALDKWSQAGWHRRWERLPVRLTVWVTIAVISASLFEIVPMFGLRSNISMVNAPQPYTPLELLGREIYISEGCYNCHSQMIRPFVAETERYGDYSKPEDSIHDRPFQWGSRRIGPDLARVGGKYSDFWHLEHFRSPQSTSSDSVMTPYPSLERKKLRYNDITSRVNIANMLADASGYKNAYSDYVLKNAEEVARKQADEIVESMVKEGAPRRVYFREADEDKYSNDPGSADPSTYVELRDTQVVALIAYVQRLGVKEAKQYGPGTGGKESGSATDLGGKPEEDRNAEGKEASSEPNKVMP